MDHERFDDLTRALATTTSRRQFLKTLAGSAAGGLLALLGIGEAAADDTCKPIGKKCRKNAQCCSGNCAEGKCAPCKDPGVACSSDSECCSGACCLTASGEKFCCDRPDGICCPPGSDALCCSAGQVCCHDASITCCPAGTTCCPFLSPVPCCAPGGDCATGDGC
jgi:hypothetical protein